MTQGLDIFILSADLAGSLGMIVVSLLCILTAVRISKREPDNCMYGYLVWFFAALFAFSISRSIGHILKHILIFSGHVDLWRVISPLSGSVNTATFIAISSITLFFHSMRKIMARTVRDRERIKKISRELLNLNQNTEAIVSERTRAELALNVAHEIRNPVTVIGGIANRLLRNSMSQEEQHKWLQTIVKQAERLNAIVKKFETLKGELTWAFQRVELTGLVDDAVEVIQQEAREKGVKIIVRHQARELFVDANDYLLKLSLLHCIRNAIEASKPGTEIVVTTEREDVGAVIRIEDHGCGIPEVLMKDIFTPFFGTKEQSSGLGLSVVKQIIDEHGGTIEIHSVEGQGTTVEIFLPSKLGTKKTWASGKAKP